MSVKELIIKDGIIEHRFRSIDDKVTIASYFGYDIPRAVATIDRNQAHLLMLYLQEHLEIKSGDGLKALEQKGYWYL